MSSPSFPGRQRGGAPGQDEPNSVGAKGSVLELTPPIHFAKYRPITGYRGTKPVFDGADRARGGCWRSGEVARLRRFAFPAQEYGQPKLGQPQLLGLQRNDRGSPQSGSQQQQQRTVSLAGEVAAAGFCQANERCRILRGYAGLPRRDAARGAQDGPHAGLGAGGARPRWRC